VTGSLRIENVSIAIHGATLVGPVDLTIAPGEVVTVMGPSGSGKSTLLAFIGGFLDRAFTARGEVGIGAERVTSLSPEKRRIGILFQDDLLFPHLSVAGNLAFGLRPDGAKREERRRMVEQALAEAGLEGFGDRDPATLSGGQRARVALMRTLLAKPRALLLDEPFGKLDRALRQDFRRFVFDHVREQALPSLLVTHDQDDADAADGRVIHLGTPDR
jgi:putative thiamine transport system ATP-binding protein